MKKIIILLLMSFQIMSCQNRTIKVTPKEFLANNNASKQLYSKDSLGLVSLIKKQIKLHEDAYHPSSYDDSTLIIIDSIMYNSDYNKLVFFIITKVENKKSYPKDWDKEKVNSIEKYGNLPYEGYHYNSNTYIGIRENDSLKINNFFRIGFNDFQNIKELKKKQRQTFFEEYAAVKEKGYEYNLNDTRFWDNPNVWDNIKEDEMKWKEFDKMKKEHPENVYEPKK